MALTKTSQIGRIREINLYLIGLSKRRSFIKRFFINYFRKFCPYYLSIKVYKQRIIFIY